MSSLFALRRITARQLCLCITERRLVPHSAAGGVSLPSSRQYTHPQLLTCAPHLDTKRWCSSTASEGQYKLVYTAPFRGAIRAIKIFSLTTAAAATIGGPVCVWFGNPSVPVVARVAISFVVMLAGLSTTAILHWMVKGYVMRLHYNEMSQTVITDLLSVFAHSKQETFHISEAGPPPQGIGFHTFKAKERSYFLHTELFQDKKLLSALLGAHGIILDNKKNGQQPKEDSEMKGVTS